MVISILKSINHSALVPTEKTLVWGLLYSCRKKINTFCRQRQMQRRECCLKSQCSTSFTYVVCLLFDSPSVRFVISYRQISYLRILSCGNCSLVVMQPLSSLLQQSFAMPFHPLPLILPSPVWAFEIRLLFNTFQNVHKTLPLVCRAAWKEVNKNDSENRTVRGC